MHNVINAQKDDVFRIRMNSEIKSELEEVFAKLKELGLQLQPAEE